MFRNNSGTAEYSIDDGSTWNKLGGSSMKCVKFGVINTGGEEITTISLSGTGIGSSNDYMVIINTGQNAFNGNYSVAGDLAYISAKSSTSFSVTREKVYTSSSYAAVSYQVIVFNQ